MHESWLNAQETGRDVQRVVENIFLIKILGTSKEEIERYDSTTKKLQDSQLKNQVFGTINSLMPNFITVFTISILFIFTNLTKTITLEFLGVTLRLVQTLGALNSSLNMMINSQVHLSKFIELENNKLIERPGYFAVDEELSKSIIMKDIKFKYFNSDEYIFDNLNLEIEKNKHTIITGPNGSGKSTLLGLISKVFYPEEGEIKLNTDDIGYVGEGSKKEELKKLAKENLVKINFLGRMNYFELQEIYKNYRIFILPSLFEGNPKALLEALASGCLVMALNNKNITEIIVHEENGIVFYPDTNLSKELENFLSSEDSFNKLTAAGYDYNRT